ncbi:SprT family zinc-dependent metalloprotease [Marinomonas sp. A79]|uniref:SprT family zinc-dependent metalloprotease n=1 Tax=Marinomonas vulgaris TaxID=2823372 RepID=A0ABS5H9T2_9GAMM|nr:SprT family zinc-dependent metalloprotease [Marinomonas vulgaris]MBR7888432.1 SprT family zinc-dependent metalloprotease [Marinomonas vulgaris]
MTTASSSLSYDQAQDLALIEQKVAECMSKANVFFGHRFKMPSYNLKQRGRAAGTAHLHKNELRFNHFMFRQHPDQFLQSVVPHEVAHIIVFQIYGNSVKPHGKEWQAVMRKVYDQSPDRTHTFDVPPPKQSFQYQCDCQTHQFSKLRHNKALRGTEYICKRCRCVLKFVSKK